MNEGPDKGASLSAVRAAAQRNRWRRDNFTVVKPHVNGYAVSPAPPPQPIEKPAPKRKALPPRPSVPYDEIVASYEKHMPGNPRVRMLSEDTKGKVSARWFEDKGRQNIAWWDQYFAYANTCPFLVGGVPTNNGREPFRADFQWMVAPTNMEKVINGRYQ